ncbi:alpha/beta hydrolase [Amycolatopsis cihanbeyliensis]
MTAVRREATPEPAGHERAEPAEIRVGHRRFAGFRTRVLEAGPRPAGRKGKRRRSVAEPPAPRLVLLHGYCDSADTWRAVLADRPAAGRPAVAVDLPGFGEADALRPGPILPQLDAFTSAVLNEQAAVGGGGGRTTVVLAGNSLGGTLGLRAAQNHRLPLAGVASIAAPGLVDSWLVRAVAKYPLPLRLYSALPVPVPGFLVRAVAQQVVPKLLYADPAAAREEEVRRFTELFPDYRATTTRLEQARQLVGELAEAYRLDRISTPLLVVACGKDKLVSPDSGRRLHALVPHSRLLVRADWGHCPQLDDPTAIAELLGFFAADAHRRRHRAGRAPGAREVAS